MINKQEVNSEIERLTAIKSLVQAYEEIAASRMKKIRESVLKSRDFQTGLADVLRNVQSSYKKEVERIMKKKKITDPSKISLVPKNGKTVSLFISANAGLYGDIVLKTFNLFLENIKNSQSDIVVIGKLGESLLKERGFDKKYTYFDFPDSHVDHNALKNIAAFLVQYEKILVFHGQFESVVTQNPNISNISDTGTLSTDETNANSKYIFEPSLENIIIFFEKEIFASIFEQTISESQLAKFACRMVTLDKATENIKGNLKKVQLERRIITHREMNRKQLEAFSGMSVWR